MSQSDNDQKAGYTAYKLKLKHELTHRTEVITFQIRRGDYSQDAYFLVTGCGVISPYCATTLGELYDKSKLNIDTQSFRRTDHEIERGLKASTKHKYKLMRKIETMIHNHGEDATAQDVLAEKYPQFG